MFGPASLMIFVALLVIGLVQAFHRRYSIGILALIYGCVMVAVWMMPPIDRSVRYADVTVAGSDSTVEISNRGPIAFTQKSQTGRGGRPIYRFSTQVETSDGRKDVVFRIWDIGEPSYNDRRTICPSKLGPAGLRQMLDAEPLGRHKTINCTVLPSTVRYISADGDGPATRIDCRMTSDGTRLPCKMRILHGRFQIKGFMLNVPPEEWRAVRDHFVSVIDQSFRIVEDP